LYDVTRLLQGSVTLGPHLLFIVAVIKVQVAKNKIRVNSMKIVKQPVFFLQKWS